MPTFTDITKPITPELVKEAEALAIRSGLLEEQIVDRINYIMQSIFKLFSKKNAYWYFYGAGEGEVGNLWAHYDQYHIDVVIDECPGESMVILLKDGTEWGFDDSIPTRWLFEDFETELTEGKKKYKELEETRKNTDKTKRLYQKEQDKKLAQVAKGKLTKKELAALKRSL